MKRLTYIQLILFMLFVGLTTIACEEEEVIGVACITYEDCSFGQQCIDGFCQDVADSGDTTGDTGNSADSVDTGNSADSANTGNSVDDGDTANSGNSVNDGDTADSGNSVDDSDTANTGNSVDDSDTANSGNSVDDSDTANTGNSVDDSDTADSGDSVDDGDTANTGNSADDGNTADDNECLLGTDNCDVNATCTDTLDSFTCACKDYYDGDGTSCTFCNTDSQCKSDCTGCDGATPKCKDNGATTACVECLTNAECIDPDICLADNTCGYAPVNHNYENNSNLDIPDLSVRTSNIVVSDSYIINALNLRIKISNWECDYKITLNPPNGSPIVVFDNGSKSDFLDISINPTDFNGQQVNGTWTLTVEDDYSSDEGTMDYWRMTING